MSKQPNAFTAKPKSDLEWLEAQKRSERATAGGRKRSAQSTERITSKKITPRKNNTWL